MQGGGECSAKRAGELSRSPVPQGPGDKLALGAPAAALCPRGLLGDHRDGLDRGPGGGASPHRAGELSWFWARVGHDEQLVRSRPRGPARSFPSAAQRPLGTWRAECASPGNHRPPASARRPPGSLCPSHPPLARCPGAGGGGGAAVTACPLAAGRKQTQFPAPDHPTGAATSVWGPQCRVHSENKAPAFAQIRFIR